MDRREQELLDKQLRRIQPPPHNEGTAVLAAVVLFLAGMTFGSLLFSYKNEPTRTASNEVHAVAGAHGITSISR